MPPFGLRRVARTRDGTYRLRLPPMEREVLAQLVDELRAVLTASTDDPAVRRLFPTAYHDDEERDREYQALVRDELLDRRLAALDVVTETIELEELDQQQLSAWMAAVNDLRLVLGTKLGVDGDPEPLEPDHPDAPVTAVYEYLGYLLHEVIEALSGALPAPDPEA